MDDEKKTLGDRHKKHHDDNWAMQNWRSWGSWFSWGSPVGLGIWYALVTISTGILIWLIHHR